MSRQSWLFVVAAVLSQLTYSAPAVAAVVWRGDFETGDRSQWSGTEMVSADRLQIVASPRRQGEFALRAEVRQGDDPINASGNRNELVKHDKSSEGTEYYYGWSTLWPLDYPLTPTWQVFAQWHHPGSNGAPPLRFVLGCSAGDCGQPLTDTMFFIVDNKQVWTMRPVTRGTWHDFVLHIKWSANASVGFVELWYDGQLVVPKRFTRTLFNSSDTNYMKLGLYRDEATQPTAVLFHDGVVQATTFAEASESHFLATDAGVDSGTPDAGPGQALDAGQDPLDAGGDQTPPPEGPDSGLVGPGDGEDTAEEPIRGCSSGPASLVPWASLLGLFALWPLGRRLRGAQPTVRARRCSRKS